MIDRASALLRMGWRPLSLQDATAKTTPQSSSFSSFSMPSVLCTVYRNEKFSKRYSISSKEYAMEVQQEWQVIIGTSGPKVYRRVLCRYFYEMKSLRKVLYLNYITIFCEWCRIPHFEESSAVQYCMYSTAMHCKIDGIRTSTSLTEIVWKDLWRYVMCLT